MTSTTKYATNTHGQSWALPVEVPRPEAGAPASENSRATFAYPVFSPSLVDASGFGRVECASVETSTIGDNSSREGGSVSAEEGGMDETLGSRRMKRKRALAASTTTSDLHHPKTSKRGVSFAKEVKGHDGLVEEHQMFDDLVWNYCGSGKIRNAAELLHHVQYDISNLRSMMDLVQALEKRVRRGPRKGVPVLPGGGGKGAKIGPEHLPVLAALMGSAFEGLLLLEERRSQGSLPLDAEVSRAKRSRSTPTSEVSPETPVDIEDGFDDGLGSMGLCEPYGALESKAGGGFELDAGVAPAGDLGAIDFDLFDASELELAEGLLAMETEQTAAPAGGGGGPLGGAKFASPAVLPFHVTHGSATGAAPAPAPFRIALPIQ